MSEQINLGAWTDPEIVAEYRDAGGLTALEASLLDKIKESCRGAKLLDIGVGAGRTTPGLLALSRDYLGLDYSEGMIALCRAKFPGVEFACRDARDLSDLPAGAFDLVFFSFNGLDYSSHEDRGRILAGIFRLLKPGGRFIFSSHNRSMKDYDRFRWPFPPLSLKPWVLLPSALLFARRMLRHFWKRRAEVREPGYAIINEPEHGYSLMTYYVTIGEQTRQLRAAGFAGAVEAYGRVGPAVVSDESSRSLYYLVSK